MNVLRWGQSAYETDADLALEAEATRRLGGRYHLHIGPDAPLEAADVLVVHSGTRVRGADLDRFAGRLIVTTTSGYDHIDLAAARARAVRVARCPLARRDAVVEHALDGMIRLLRRLPALEAEAVRGRWARSDLPKLAPRAIAGATIAVVGLGVIGTRMVEVLRALGANVIGIDPNVSLPDLEMGTIDDVPRADAITLHCSLGTSSRALISAARIATLRPEQVLVNTARGDVLDLDAAIAAVQHGRLRGLAVDVFPDEPYPSLASGAQTPGILFTPHASGYVHDLGARVAREVAATLTAFVRDETLPNLVTEDR
jgi:phosphoglycerate dehydrogenase-like enzyme